MPMAHHALLTPNHGHVALWWAHLASFGGSRRANPKPNPNTANGATSSVSCSPLYVAPFAGLRVAPMRRRSTVARLAVSESSDASRASFCEPYFSKLDSNQFAFEREEIKAFFQQYLNKKGFSSTMASRVVNKSGLFIVHMISMLHERYYRRYLNGRQLTTTEIQNTLLPYAECLTSEYGDDLIAVMMHFPNPPPPEYYRRKPVCVQGVSSPTKKKKRAPTLTVIPSVSFLQAIGISEKQAQSVAHNFPSIANCDPEKKMKPIVSFLLSLGVSRSDLGKVFLMRPQIFGCSLEANLKPNMAYLESWGVERRMWANLLVQFPALITYKREKIELVTGFLTRLGLSSVDVGRVLTVYPFVVSFNVEQKLQPIVDYLSSIGIRDIGSFVLSHPQVLGYSIEGNLKPTILFFVNAGFTKEEIAIITRRYPQVLSLSIDKNLKFKWDYFAQTGWPRSEIVMFPQYFGYSFVKRIKPRIEKVRAKSLKWRLNRILSLSESDLESMLSKEGHT